MVYTLVLILLHEYVTILTQNEALGAATASGGGRAPIASFWVRIMTSCMNIKRSVLLDAQLKQKFTLIVFAPQSKTER